MTDVTIFSRQDCHLCEVVLRMARRIQIDIPFRLEHIDISGDPDLSYRHGTRIPVVLIDRVERFAGQVTERELRAAIKKARWRGPISRILSRFRSALRRG